MYIKKYIWSTNEQNYHGDDITTDGAIRSAVRDEDLSLGDSVWVSPKKPVLLPKFNAFTSAEDLVTTANEHLLENDASFWEDEVIILSKEQQESLEDAMNATWMKWFSDHPDCMTELWTASDPKEYKVENKHIG